jgi:hypothetical protein
MRAFSHKIHFKDGPDSFTTATVFKQGQDTLEIKTDKGAVCKIRHTPTSLTMTAGDETHRRKFTLTLITNAVDKQIQGSMRIDDRTFRAKGAPKQVLRLLNEQVQKAKIGAKLPRSPALSRLADKMRKDQKLVTLMLGISLPAAERKSYCEAVCDACAAGGPFSPWYCLSCASCDFFEVDLADKIGTVVAPV